MAIKIFFCYAHEDEALLNDLRIRLKPLQRLEAVDVWHDRDISAGVPWEEEIKKQLDAAQVILLLVSPDFLASDYCYSIEMKRALVRHEQREARVIPVILRSSPFWRETPLGQLQALPTDAIPIVDHRWHNPDEAFLSVAEGIRNVVKELLLHESDADYEIGRFEKALEILEHLLRLAPGDAHLYKRKGDALRKIGRNTEALAAFEQAIVLDPDYATAWCNKGYVLRDFKHDEEALYAFEQAFQRY